MDDNYIEISTEIMQSLTPEQAWHYLIVPKKVNEETLELYHSFTDRNKFIEEELEILFGRKIILHRVAENILRRTLSKYYLRKNHNISDQSIIRGKTIDFDLKTNDFLFDLLNEASDLRCSDIHIEAYEEEARIRFRIDGKLIERYVIKKDVYPALINQIKILSNLDIAEKRLPQDGRILFKTVRLKYDIRVSIIPAIFGEKVVLRLLGKIASDLNITELGFTEAQFKDYLKGIKRTNGICLISGPTGSGKTTTLYATLNILNKKDTNIVTIEDPIEYTIQGVNQVQLREDIGLTFAKALKTFLRQDPDIIMLGEIRDEETAHMAIRASLTGHLVLSTIHTNSAWGIISRLIDMGIPPFLLASTINVVVAQRLVRKLCRGCKKEEQLDINKLPFSIQRRITQKTHFTPVGCELCNYSGYRGRTAVYEAIYITKELKEYIQQSKTEVKDHLSQNGIMTLSSSALKLFIEGSTSFEEIYPIINDDL